VAGLAHAGRGQTSNSQLPEELRLKCFNIGADQFHGFGSTLVHGKFTTIPNVNISIKTNYYLSNL